MKRDKESSEIRERMMQLCKHINLSPNKLSQDMGKSRDYIRQLGTSITSDCLQYIYRTYPDIDIIWIITGDRTMVKTAQEDNEDFTILLRLYEQERSLNLQLSQENERLKKELTD